MRARSISKAPSAIARLIAMLGSLVVVASCSSPSSQNSTNETLVVDTSFQAVSADPQNAAGQTDRLFDLQVYQPLLLVDQRNYSKLDPDVAQSYSVSADGLTYTFNLRHDIHFSDDGSSLTSADVVFSLLRLANLGGGNASVMHGLTMGAPDPYTVTVSSHAPNPAIPYDVATPPAGIVNSKTVMAHGGSDASDAVTADKAGSYLNQHSVGSGPYTLVSFDPQSLIVLKANPSYAGPKPAYSKVELRNVAAQTQLLDVQTTAHTLALDLSPAQAATLDKSKAASLSVPSFEVFVIGFSINAKVSNVSANQNFRSAVRYAVDYQGLLKIAGAGVARAPGLLAAGQVGALPPDQAVSTDLAKARDYLAASGLKSPTISLEYPSDVTDNGIGYADTAAKVQSDLSQIGIKVNLVPEPGILWKSRWKAGKVPMMVTSLGGLSFDSSNLFNFAVGAYGATRMGVVAGSDPVLDSIYAQISATKTNSQRAPLYLQAQQELNSFAVWIPLFEGGVAVASSLDVKGLNTDGQDEVRFWTMS